MGKETLETDLKLNANILKVGFPKAMKAGWIKLASEKKDKVKKIVRTADKLEDEGRKVLLNFKNNPDESTHEKKLIDEMKKRKLIAVLVTKSYKVTKGENYAPAREKLETQLTADMLKSGSWKDTKFKKQNLDAAG